MGVVTREFTVEQRGLSLPDYAAPKPVGTVPIGPVYTSTDVAELAVRLGSIDTFDRRGNVLFIDGFEDELNKWYVYGSAGYSAAPLATYAKTGTFSAKLTTAPITDSFTVMVHTMPFPTLSKIGLEFSFLKDDLIKQLLFRLVLHGREWQVMGSIIWLAEEKRWTYYGSDGQYHDLEPTLELPGPPTDFPLFHTTKLVADFVSEQYTRLIVNNTIYNLANLKLNKVANGEPPRLGITISVTTKEDAATNLYVDDVIITQNEPPNP